MQLTLSSLTVQLRELGLKSGMDLVTHASLKSLGMVAGGAPTVVEALRNAISPNGTDLFPTFNYFPDLFDVTSTPSVVGAVSEAARSHPAAVRSLNPTHSIVAIGSRARFYLDNHDK